MLKITFTRKGRIFQLVQITLGTENIEQKQVYLLIYLLVSGNRTCVGMATGEKTYRGRYFPPAQNSPKWVTTMRKNPSPIDGKETFHMDPRSPGDMAEKTSQESSHVCQIVASKRNNN